MNFVTFVSFNIIRYQHFNTNDQHVMAEVAKSFIHCLNTWDFEKPKIHAQRQTNEDASTYKINYTRWLVFCHVPAFCNSLRHFETTLVFGRSLLKAIYPYFSQLLLHKCKQARDQVPMEKRAIFAQMPRFLENLRHEVLDDNSPIWDPNFKPPLGLLFLKKRERENATTVSNNMMKTISDSPAVKKFRRDPADQDDLTDDMLMDTLKRLNKSNINMTEV